MSWIGDEVKDLFKRRWEELWEYLITTKDFDEKMSLKTKHEIIKARGFSPHERLKDIGRKYGVELSYVSQDYVPKLGDFLVIDTVKGVPFYKIRGKTEKKLERQFKKLEEMGYEVISGFSADIENEEIKKSTFTLIVQVYKGIWIWKKPVTKIKIEGKCFAYSMDCLDKPELRETIDLLATELYGLYPK